MNRLNKVLQQAQRAIDVIQQRISKISLIKTEHFINKKKIKEPFRMKKIPSKNVSEKKWGNEM